LAYVCSINDDNVEHYNNNFIYSKWVKEQKEKGKRRNVHIVGKRES